MSINIIQTIQKIVDRVDRRVKMLVSRAVVQLVNESLTCQNLQVVLLAEEVRDNVEHFQPYGLTTKPLAGAEGVYLSVGGNRDHGIVVAVQDRRYRPTTLADGEVALHTTTGIKVHCKANDEVLLGPSPTNYVALANLVLDRMTAIVNAYNAHTHPTGTGPSGVPASPLSTPAAVAATKVKAV
jgi:phage gp45-like